MYVFACQRGRLELTLLGKQGQPVEIRLDRRVVARVTPPTDGFWNGSIPAPADADGTRVCAFQIQSPGLVGSTRIEFVRD